MTLNKISILFAGIVSVLIILGYFVFLIFISEGPVVSLIIHKAYSQHNSTNIDNLKQSANKNISETSVNCIK